MFEAVDMKFYQIGFRKGHSTVDAAVLVINEAKEAYRRNKTIMMAALDISKAFDGVWTKGLIKNWNPLKLGRKVPREVN